ncbi:hypothetical protein FACS1894156_6850 [Bacteroidia bacterium]|nr:hypothetical protein FACS1894156_6850 [Bacteroidia bacterium]
MKTIKFLMLVSIFVVGSVSTTNAVPALPTAPTQPGQSNPTPAPKPLIKPAPAPPAPPPTPAPDPYIYYAPNKIVTRNEFTYVCYEWLQGGIWLYNQNNTLTFVKQTFKDGSIYRYDNMELDAYPEHWVSTDALFTNIYNAISPCLTPAEQKLVTGDKLIVSLYINPNTGKIIEVEYSFVFFRNGWCRLPPEKFFAMEQALKQQITFNITAEGKKLNYCICVFPVKITQPAPETSTSSGNGNSNLIQVK